MLNWLRNRKQKQHGLTGPTLQVLIRTLPLWAMLSPLDQEELGQLVARFLARKQIEACGGLNLTDTMRVSVAAYACLLLLRRRHDLYPHLGTVLLYPSAYVARHTEVDEIGIHEERAEVMLGESWERGNVVLSWQDIAIDCAAPDDGFNVIVHEFAHQLDGENGALDGAPQLPRSMRAQWAEVMHAEYQALCEFADSLPESADEEPEAGLDPTFGPRRARTQGDWVIDPYGAEDPAEFFAVATEAFFEDAPAMLRRHPAVYRQLQQFYQQDPAAWPGWAGRDDA